MNRPIHRHRDISYDPNKVIFYFSDDTVKEMHVKGGICYPFRHTQKREGLATQETTGYALVGCQDLRTGSVHIYEETSWVSLNDILATDSPTEKVPVNTVKYHGLAHWLNRVRSEYFCEKYYANQPPALHDLFALEKSRNSMIQPKPQFINEILDITHESQYLDLIWLLLNEHKLKIDAECQLARDLAVQNVDESYIPASIRALGCCISAFKQFPYRRPHQQAVQEYWST